MLRAKYLKISWRYRLTYIYSVQTLSHLSMHLRWKICWQGSSRMRCRLTNSDIQTTHDVCVTAPPLPLDCFTASSDRWLAAADVNWNEASRSMSALDRPLGLDSLSWRARPNNAYTNTHSGIQGAFRHIRALSRVSEFDWPRSVSRTFVNNCSNYSEQALNAQGRDWAFGSYTGITLSVPCGRLEVVGQRFILTSLVAFVYFGADNENLTALRRPCPLTRIDLLFSYRTRPQQVRDCMHCQCTTGYTFVGFLILTVFLIFIVT